MQPDITIHQGFPDALRQDAAALYDAAFGPKLAIGIPDDARRLAVLQQGIDPRFALAATSNGRLAGIAGFKTSAGAFTGDISFGLLRTQTGLGGALRAALIFSLFERKPAPEQLLMDGIAVAPEMRGQGVGTRLLRQLMVYGRDAGYHTLRLDVIDINPAARRLYERVGFVAVRTERFPALKWLLGFAAATEMHYDLRKFREENAQ